LVRAQVGEPSKRDIDQGLAAMQGLFFTDAADAILERFWRTSNIQSHHPVFVPIRHRQANP
ncbi:MAG: hypothetical protein ABW032_00650, partial [Burkholderiaceae bacterium]